MWTWSDRLVQITSLVTAGHVFGEAEQTGLTVMHDLMKAGKVIPVIDRRYRLSEVADAIRYLEERHAQGKVVIISELI